MATVHTEGMTPLQTRFVEQYMLDPRPGPAAKKAGSKAKNTDAAGNEFLKNPKVAAEIRRRQAERAEETKIDARWVLDRLSQEALADVADIHDADGNVLPVHEWPLIWRQGLVQGIDVTEKISKDGKITRSIKVKVSDRIRRLELIGKHVDIAAFAEQLQHSGKDGGPIETRETGNAAENLARRVAFILAKGLQKNG